MLEKVTRRACTKKKKNENGDIIYKNMFIGIYNIFISYLNESFGNYENLLLKLCKL